MHTETKYHEVGDLHSFLTSLLGGVEWSFTHSGCFTRGKKAAVQIEEDAG